MLGLAKVLVKRRENPDRGVNETQVCAAKNESRKTAKAVVV